MTDKTNEVEALKTRLAKTVALAEQEKVRADKAELLAKEGEQDKVKERKGVIYLTAKVKGVNEDGGKEIFVFESSGKTTKEVLDSLVFPKGLNSLAIITVKKDGKETEFTMSPRKAHRLLFEKETFVLDVIIPKL